ncbi:UBN2_3 domain-containing protein [Cephalotus follicularis]|uniref:UBN2_3 domain-containing protein n=1 Tax=Cephalotus follicularis TaxID=3775 RepID=A0A1Q3D291_CEPFO|nr:UBN2_3 domain-containing protein [Cephalotus follicularis]
MEESGTSGTFSNNRVVVTKVTRSVNHNTSLQISPMKFDGTNYLAWSKAYMISVRANKLARYFTGKTICPKDEEGEEKWLSEDALVMSWLLHSIKPALSPQYMMIDSAKDIWEAIARQYSHRNNYAQAYEIRQKIKELKQGELSFATYYSAMTYLWQQLDSYRTFRHITASDDLLAFQSDIEKEQVYDFLGGLNSEYDPIRIQILGRESFPTLKGAYNLL